MSPAKRGQAYLLATPLKSRTHPTPLKPHQRPLLVPPARSHKFLPSSTHRKNRQFRHYRKYSREISLRHCSRTTAYLSILPTAPCTKTELANVLEYADMHVLAAGGDHTRAELHDAAAGVEQVPLAYARAWGRSIWTIRDTLRPRHGLRRVRTPLRPPRWYVSHMQVCRRSHIW